MTPVQTRIDWVTVTVKGTNENCQERVTKMGYDLAQLMIDGTHGGYRPRISNNGFKGKLAMMHMDVWGPLAHAWAATLSLPFIAAHVTRLDFRAEVGITEHGHMSVLQQLQEEGTGRLNLATNSSRLRLKTAKRDAGGVWFGLGSVKSGRSLRVYVRGQERGAVEVHLQGKALAPFLARWGNQYRDQPAERAWDALLSRLDGELSVSLTECGGFIGLSEDELLSALCKQKPEPMVVVWEKLWELRVAMLAAGIEGDDALYRAVQERIAVLQEKGW